MLTADKVTEFFLMSDAFHTVFLPYVGQIRSQCPRNGRNCSLLPLYIADRREAAVAVGTDIDRMCSEYHLWNIGQTVQRKISHNIHEINMLPKKVHLQTVGIYRQVTGQNDGRKTLKVEAYKQKRHFCLLLSEMFCVI